MEQCMSITANGKKETGRKEGERERGQIQSLLQREDILVWTKNAATNVEEDHHLNDRREIPFHGNVDRFRCLLIITGIQ